MPNPINYSTELPRRCISLLDRLLPQAADLTSTFILSMSVPIIILPMERMFGAEGFADDRLNDPAPTAAINTTLGDNRFGRTRFFLDRAWHFVCWQEKPFPNIARGIPENIAEKLASAAAAEAAAKMSAARWCHILRNALAHGAIAYLDERGRSSPQSPAHMYAFVSKQCDPHTKKLPKPTIAMNLLRISEADYSRFLHLWVDWLDEFGTAEASEGQCERLLL